ncbi:MAG: hypothetical protein Q9227_008106 [Pyrenula ochraceoflavens]
MAPAVVEVAAGSAAKEFKKESAMARLLGSGRPLKLFLGNYLADGDAGCAGISELFVFHPVDTITKRLMSNQGKVNSTSQLNAVIFKEHASSSIGTKFTSLFPGLGYAAGYKILQRIYNLIGIGEIILLPLDVLKIKRQTNPEAFRGRGVFRIIADEGMGLYRGASWTAARNAPGSFAVRLASLSSFLRFALLTFVQLFGGSAFAKEYIYKLQDYNRATWTQNFVASIAGATASLVVSAPLDVIKTRIQNRNFENPEGGFRILSNMVRHEGFSSFFKGLTPKLLMTGPKLIFSFWLLDPLFAVVVGGYAAATRIKREQIEKHPERKELATWQGIWDRTLHLSKAYGERHNYLSSQAKTNGVKDQEK